MYTDRKIDKIVRKYQHECDCRCAKRLASDLGIVLMQEELGDPTKNKAMTLTINRVSLIILNRNLPDVVREFILFHEIGHYTLHKDYFKTTHIERDEFANRTMEIEANIFAAQMLISDNEILDELERGEYTHYQLAAIHKVPPELLSYKLMMLEKKGYDIPSLDYPQPDFLLGDLGINEICCYD